MLDAFNAKFPKIKAWHDKFVVKGSMSGRISGTGESNCKESVKPL